MPRMAEVAEKGRGRGGMGHGQPWNSEKAALECKECHPLPVMESSEVYEMYRNGPYNTCLPACIAYTYYISSRHDVGGKACRCYSTLPVGFRTVC